MKQTYLIIGLIIVAIIAAILIFKQKPIEGVILFFGQECKHCARVEEFIKNNKIDEKIKINRREVLHNQENASLLAKTAKKCGITDSELAVPLVWDGDKCYQGESETIDFFRQYLK